MNRSWFVNELAHAGPEHLDPEFVAGYDRKQGYPDVEGDLLVLRELGSISSAATVVDLGAGTGRFAIAASAHCLRVVAVDISNAMTEHIQRAAADAGARNVECVVAGFLSYQHKGRPADAVYSRNALHQLPDFWKGIALDRVAQMLRPGGVFLLHDLVYDFSPQDAIDVLERWMGAGAQDPAEGYTAEDFATHVRTEFSTYNFLLEPLIESAGLDILNRNVKAQVYATYTCIKR